MSDLTLASLLQAWRFRKWYFILPALIVPVLAFILAFKLPPVYESKSTILIEEQQIPQDFVRSTVTGYADQHVQLLTQQILSRTRLWEIVEKFNLYAKERTKDTKENILDQMRKDIKFETISAEVQDKKKGRGAPTESVTIAFKISYQGDNPDLVQKVTNTLASFYLEENLKYREGQAQTTTKFLEAELKELKEKINQLGIKTSEFKATHPGTLPELREFNQSQVVSLDSELKRLDGDINAAQNQKIYLEGLLGTARYNRSEVDTDGIVKDPRARLQALNEILKSFRAKYSEDHPDIQNLNKEKAQIEQFLKSQGSGGDIQNQWKLAQLQADLAAKQARYSEQHPDVKKLKMEIDQLLTEAKKGNPTLGDMDMGNPVFINLTTQVNQINNQIDTLTKLRQKQQEKLEQFRHRLEETPKIEQEYLSLQRDYQNSHSKYQEVMNKLLEARIAEGMEEHQKGEKFTMVDPASLPEEPIKPKKKLIALAGLILGLGTGLALFTASESLDTSIKSGDELAALTKMAPLGIIGRINTPFDQIRRRRRRWFALAVTVFSLLTAMALIHFLYLDIYIIMIKIQRLAKKI
jgi:polysaccharide biosynthesis transport protein